MLAYARGERPDPPPELRWYFLTLQYGLPQGGGWMEQDAATFGRMVYAGQLYEAAKGYAEAPIGKKAAWKAEYPELWAMLKQAENEVNDGG